MKFLVAIVIIFVVYEVESISYSRRCYQRCSSKVLLVCGNDGKNYVNECALRRAACENPYAKLRKLHDGLCEDVFGRLRGAVFDPVCASDKNTYSNAIFVDVAKYLKNRSIRVLSKGLCSCGSKCNLNISKCDIGCPKVLNPVCGDDGETYVNECALGKQNCILGGKALKKLHNGPCKIAYSGIVGIEKFSPVCGSDGNTYSSKAFFDVARCQNRYLRIKKYSACSH